MAKKLPIFYNALLLTGVNLLLRFAGTSFQVYLSGRIGAEGIGLLQLVLSVGSLALTVGMGGIRTATMYLCAEVVGQKQPGRMGWVLSGCIVYSISVSGAAAFLLYQFAPLIAAGWIGNPAVCSAIRLFAAFLPVSCLCGVMVGYYTGINRIGTLAAVEVAEQICSMAATILLLQLWADSDAVKACQCVILGSSIGACLTLFVLTVLKHRHKEAVGERLPMGERLWDTAVPLAVADTAKAGINTTENLMVPKRLALYPGTSAPLAQFGMVCGMVFPVLMFPAAILFGLAELLIPEMARCNAAGSQNRIHHLAERSLLLALIYGCVCGGILFLAAEPLCRRLYKTPEAGMYLRWFAVLAPMLYCDTITDALTKGLGQQKICVRNNIITSALDVIFLFLLLPHYWMQGYFASFFLTHLLNFALSMGLLVKLVGRVIPMKTAFACLLAAVGTVIAAGFADSPLSCICFVLLFAPLLVLLGVVNGADLAWVKGLVQP